MSNDTIRLTLPEKVIKEYEEQGKGKPAEWVMAERLRNCVTLNSEKPIILIDTERREIERLLSRNLSTGAELVQHVKNALSVRAEGQMIPLPPRLLSRLQSRSIGVDFDKFLPDLIVKLLEQYAGLR